MPSSSRIGGDINHQKQQEMFSVLQQLCQELEVGDYSDLLAKVRELKQNQSKVRKEQRLITNMKMLVKDTQKLTSQASATSAKTKVPVIKDISQSKQLSSTIPNTDRGAARGPLPNEPIDKKRQNFLTPSNAVQKTQSLQSITIEEKSATIDANPLSKKDRG